MRAPQRLRDDPEAGASVRSILGSASASRPMSREVRERSQARVDRLAVVPAAAGLLFWMKGVAIAASAVAIGSVGVAVVVHATRQHIVPVAPARAATPVVSRSVSVLPSVEAPSAPPVPGETVPTPPRNVRAPVAPPIVTAPVDGLAIEASMLERARGELAQDPSAALATLDAYARQFPNGVLAPERELLAMEALRRLGRTREARQRGEALLARPSGSLYEARVRGLLVSLPE